MSSSNYANLNKAEVSESLKELYKEVKESTIAMLKASNFNDEQIDFFLGLFLPVVLKASYTIGTRDEEYSGFMRAAAHFHEAVSEKCRDRNIQIDAEIDALHKKRMIEDALLLASATKVGQA